MGDMSPEVAQLVDYLWEETSGKLKDVLAVPVESMKTEQVRDLLVVAMVMWAVSRDWNQYDFIIYSPVVHVSPSHPSSILPACHSHPSTPPSYPPPLPFCPSPLRLKRLKQLSSPSEGC